MSVQDWSETWRETTGYPNEIQAIEALALLLDGKVSAPETAKTITMTYERSIRAGMVQCPEETVSITDSVTDFWEREMCDAIRTFGNVDTHERLMDLLVEISRQPDILDPRGRQVMHAGKHGRDSVYWSGVPGWESALVALGLFICYTPGFSPIQNEKYLARIPDYLNATRFAATLLARGLFAEALPNEAACALEHLLEHSYDEHSHHTPGVKIEDWPAMIPAAAIWLLIAGQQIYDHCVSGDTGNGWDEGRWSLELWALWKERLRIFTEALSLSEDCRYFAAETLKEMVKIEEERGAD